MSGFRDLFALVLHWWSADTSTPPTPRRVVIHTHAGFVTATDSPWPFQTPDPIAVAVDFVSSSADR